MNDNDDHRKEPVAKHPTQGATVGRWADWIPDEHAAAEEEEDAEGVVSGTDAAGVSQPPAVPVRGGPWQHSPVATDDAAGAEHVDPPLPPLCSRSGAAHHNAGLAAIRSRALDAAAVRRTGVGLPLRDASLPTTAAVAAAALAHLWQLSPAARENLQRRQQRRDPAAIVARGSGGAGATTGKFSSAFAADTSAPPPVLAAMVGLLRWCERCHHAPAVAALHLRQPYLDTTGRSAAGAAAAVVSDDDDDDAADPIAAAIRAERDAWPTRLVPESLAANGMCHACEQRPALAPVSLAPTTSASTRGAGSTAATGTAVAEAVGDWRRLLGATPARGGWGYNCVIVHRCTAATTTERLEAAAAQPTAAAVPPTMPGVTTLVASPVVHATDAAVAALAGRVPSLQRVVFGTVGHPGADDKRHRTTAAGIVALFAACPQLTDVESCAVAVGGAAADAVMQSSSDALTGPTRSQKRRAARFGGGGGFGVAVPHGDRTLALLGRLFAGPPRPAYNPETSAFDATDPDPLLAIAETAMQPRTATATAADGANGAAGAASSVAVAAAGVVQQRMHLAAHGCGVHMPSDNVGDLGFRHLATGPAARWLRSLDLSGSMGLTSDGVVAGLSGLPAADDANASNGNKKGGKKQQQQPKLAPPLAPATTGFPRLRSLCLSECPAAITTLSVCAIAAHCPALTSLDLAVVRFRAPTLSDAALCALGAMPSLTTLALDNCRGITDAGLAGDGIDGTGGLAASRSLRNVTVNALPSHTSITDHGVTAMVRALGPRGLAELGIVGCAVTDGGTLRALTQHARSLHTLHCGIGSGNGVSEVSAAGLLGCVVVLRNPHLARHGPAFGVGAVPVGANNGVSTGAGGVRRLLLDPTGGALPADVSHELSTLGVSVAWAHV